MEVDYFRFTLAILSTFRIAQLLPLDDGPFYVFKRMREFADKKAQKAHDQKNKDKKEGEKLEKSLGIWPNVYDAVTCPYCQGLHFAFLCVLLLIFLITWIGMMIYSYYCSSPPLARSKMSRSSPLPAS